MDTLQVSAHVRAQFINDQTSLVNPIVMQQKCAKSGVDLVQVTANSTGIFIHIMQEKNDVGGVLQTSSLAFRANVEISLRTSSAVVAERAGILCSVAAVDIMTSARL